MAGHPIFAAIYDRMLAGVERAGLAERRASVVSRARGATLELGAGTGHNLEHYGPAVESLTLTEPDPHMAARLRARLAEHPPAPRTQVIEAGAERLPFDDASFDSVVSTLVLCTVADQGRALAEVARVLRPDGELLLFEHVRHPDGGSRARWQDRLERPWGWFAGGCHPNRDTLAGLRAAGYDVSAIGDDELPRGGPLLSAAISGSAKPASGSRP